MEYVWHYESPLGGMTMASDGEALTGLWFDGQRHFGAAPGCEERWVEVFGQTCRWLETYFSGEDPGFMPKLDLRVTEFRREVCEEMLAIPFGETLSYGEIAARLARRSGCGRISARAIGAAVARNPVSLIIPCHRVIGADGSLTGYAAGLQRKSWLLSMEKAGRQL